MRTTWQSSRMRAELREERQTEQVVAEIYRHLGPF
jgi:hypothetical protein